MQGKGSANRFRTAFRFFYKTYKSYLISLIGNNKSFRLSEVGGYGAELVDFVPLVFLGEAALGK